MKQQDPRLRRFADERTRPRNKGPADQDATDRRSKNMIPKNKLSSKRPPVPWFIVGGIGFSILIISSFEVTYEFGTIYHIPDILFLLAFCILLVTLYYAVSFGLENRADHATRFHAAIGALIVVLILGVAFSSYVFVTKEPYHDWSYEADLYCTIDCKVHLPVPMKDGDDAFFDDDGIIIEGPADARVISLRYEGRPIVALEVLWSGNVSLKASMDKDYRTLPMGSYGLWNRSDGRFIVVAFGIPDGTNASLKIMFSHEHMSLDNERDRWSIGGPIENGVNHFESNMD